MPTCIICGKDIPEGRKKKDTCSDEHAYEKMTAWALFLNNNKDKLMKEALEWYAGVKDNLPR